jgi:hypothetical protein
MYVDVAGKDSTFFHCQLIRRDGEKEKLLAVAVEKQISSVSPTRHNLFGP